MVVIRFRRAIAATAGADKYRVAIIAGKGRLSCNNFDMYYEAYLAGVNVKKMSECKKYFSNLDQYEFNNQKDFFIAAKDKHSNLDIQNTQTLEFNPTESNTLSLSSEDSKLLDLYAESEGYTPVYFATNVYIDLIFMVAISLIISLLTTVFVVLAIVLRDSWEYAVINVIYLSVIGVLSTAFFMFIFFAKPRTLMNVTHYLRKKIYKQ